MKSFLAFAVLIAATIRPATATMVVYSTAGSNFSGAGFTTGNQTDTVTVVDPNTNFVASLVYVGPGPGPGAVTINTSTNPTNISYGFITEFYSGDGGPINVPAFTFHLIVNDLTSNVSGVFIGTAPASVETDTTSTLVISWSTQPLILGNATFLINSPTTMTSPMQVSLDGSVSTSPGPDTPEPGSLSLLVVASVAFAIEWGRRVTVRANSS